MKYSTANQLIDKMLSGAYVKLRKSKHGGISTVTWNSICDALFYRGYFDARYSVMHFQDGTDQAVIYIDKVVISAKVILY